MYRGDDFMFELNDEEVENLSRCKNFTLNMGRGSNIKYKPYVFTEQEENIQRNAEKRGSILRNRSAGLFMPGKNNQCRLGGLVNMKIWDLYVPIYEKL